MDAYALEWLNLALRWAHVIVGIAWIGSSFYFVWLDTNLETPPRNPEDERVFGDLWAVHGGGFYHAQKYTVAPAALPERLHWFKWEAYSTWLTGFALLCGLYYTRPATYLIDPRVLAMSGGTAIALSLGLLLGAWAVYELLCRLLRDDRAIAATGAVLIAATAWGVCQLFGGRGAYIQVGAMLGTVMAANVLMVIIPGQRRMVAAMQAGEEPDPEHGRRGKQRSVHNNYLTLPVVLLMISNHYAMTFGHAWNWLIMLALFVAGVLIRHFFNLRNRGRTRWSLPAAAAALFVLVAIAAAPARQPPPAGAGAAPAGASRQAPVTTAEVHAIIARRCTACHAASPTHPSAPVAPNGVVLDTPAQIDAWAGRIYERSAVTRTMPPGNLTAMTEPERQAIAAWYRGRQ